MTNDTIIEGLVGESTAERIQRAKDKRWRISDALTTDYTNQEKNPPEGVSKRKRTRIQLGGVSRFIIKKAQSEYGLSDETETVKKLLRNGLQEIYLEWEDEIQKLGEIEDAITHSSGYIQEDISINVSDEDWDLKMESSSRSDRFYIFWYQEFYADNLSKRLDIPKSQVLQLAIILAGRELRTIDEIPNEKGRKIDEIIEDVDEKLERRISNIEQLAFGTMIAAWDSKDVERLRAKLQEECPKVLTSFSNRVEQISDSLNTRT